MRYSHLEILLEERSMHTALRNLLPKLLVDVTYNFHVFNGKHNLLRNLEARMIGYANMFKDWDEAAVVVLIDEDRADCIELKTELEGAAAKAGLGTLSSPKRGVARVLNRIVVEELEAWFFGDPEAVIAAFPKVKRRAFAQAALRDPDSIRGGTWEAMERLLTKHGYHTGGLGKVACADSISTHMTVGENASRSFNQFSSGLDRLIKGGR